MSDTSQGPGWWLASDGKWYSPEQVLAPDPPAAAPTEPVVAVAPVTPPPTIPPPTPSPAPAPATKGGSGCLKAFLIVAAVMAVLAMGLFVLLAFVVSKGVDKVNDSAKAEQKVEDRTGIKSNPFLFNADHPPQ